MQRYNEVMDQFLEFYCDRTATWQQVAAITAMVVVLATAWLYVVANEDHPRVDSYAVTDGVYEEVTLVNGGPLITDNFR